MFVSRHSCTARPRNLTQGKCLERVGGPYGAGACRGRILSASAARAWLWAAPACFWAAPVWAGAWTPDQGHGEVIVTTFVDQASQAFDQRREIDPDAALPQRAGQCLCRLWRHGLADGDRAAGRAKLIAWSPGKPALHGLGDSETAAPGAGMARRFDGDFGARRALARRPSAARPMCFPGAGRTGI